MRTTSKTFAIISIILSVSLFIVVSFLVCYIIAFIFEGAAAIFIDETVREEVFNCEEILCFELLVILFGYFLPNLVISIIILVRTCKNKKRNVSSILMLVFATLDFGISIYSIIVYSSHLEIFKNMNIYLVIVSIFNILNGVIGLCESEKIKNKQLV